MKDYYEILNVPTNASPRMIRKSYLRLVKKYHPDQCFGDKGAEEYLKEVNEAYDVLSDKEKKLEYDQMWFDYATKSEDDEKPVDAEEYTFEKDASNASLNRQTEIKSGNGKIWGWVFKVSILCVIAWGISKYHPSEGGFKTSASNIINKVSNTANKDNITDKQMIGALDGYLAGIKERDINEASKYIEKGTDLEKRSIEVCEILNEELAGSPDDILYKLAKESGKFTYKVKDVLRNGGDKCNVEVEFKTDNLAPVLMSMQQGVVELLGNEDALNEYIYNSVLSREVTTEEELVDLMYNQLGNEFFKDKRKKIKIAVVFHMENQEAEWMIKDVNNLNDLMRAFIGNVSAAEIAFPYPWNDSSDEPSEMVNNDKGIKPALEKNGYGAIRDGSDCIFPYSSERYLKEEEVEKYATDKRTLRIARNEIYARHGFKFDKEDLIAHFSQFSWYHPKINDTEETILNEYERHNIDIIKKYENMASDNVGVEDDTHQMIKKVEASQPTVDTDKSASSYSGYENIVGQSEELESVPYDKKMMGKFCKNEEEAWFTALLYVGADGKSLFVSIGGYDDEGNNVSARGEAKIISSEEFYFEDSEDGGEYKCSYDQDEDEVLVEDRSGNGSSLAGYYSR